MSDLVSAVQGRNRTYAQIIGKPIKSPVLHQFRLSALVDIPTERLGKVSKTFLNLSDSPVSHVMAKSANRITSQVWQETGALVAMDKLAEEMRRQPSLMSVVQIPKIDISPHLPHAITAQDIIADRYKEMWSESLREAAERMRQTLFQSLYEDSFLKQIREIQDSLGVSDLDISETKADLADGETAKCSPEFIEQMVERLESNEQLRQKVQNIFVGPLTKKMSRKESLALVTAALLYLVEFVERSSDSSISVYDFLFALLAALSIVISCGERG
ncbi:hypothetical protein G7Y31_09600 [Corynebacterium lizhenjunii]|uniref:Uncharacterized protein n=1 Tax=Corynebacterium lizhenjunii TaxID=2709394 RepID=A0A7T0KF34_9CORY|nr:hypothetical protein [Corynebacterium lizhenjunii]QPK78784.1 hypothetical protein G7Y31_09600 [Corynebacterium lizhenjunii]